MQCLGGFSFIHCHCEEFTTRNLIKCHSEVRTDESLRFLAIARNDKELVNFYINVVDKRGKVWYPL